MNPCIIPEIPIDIQGDNRWMSQVYNLKFLFFCNTYTVVLLDTFISMNVMFLKQKNVNLMLL